MESYLLGCNQVPTGVSFPRRFADRSAEGLNSPQHLGVRDESGLFFVRVTGERRREPGSVKEKISVLGRHYGRYRGPRRRVGEKRVDELTPVRGEGSDVKQSGNSRVVSSFRDHGPTVRVAHKERRATRGPQSSLHHRGVFFQRESGILDNGDIVSVLSQNPVDAFAAGDLRGAAISPESTDPTTATFLS